MALKNQKGFSLIEILIVMIIMAVMAVMTSRAIRSANMNKQKIDARMQVEGGVFDALRLITADVEKAFHYQYVIYEMERQALLEKAQQAKQTNPTQQQQEQPPLPPPIRYTQFIGKENSMHFTSLNNQRTTANAQESNLMEVGYYLATCKSRSNAKKSSQCLWRRSSTVVDNDVTRDGTATPLLENVSMFKLEYLSDDPQVKEWRSTWLTDTSGDANTQNLFPLFVRITLETEDKESKVIGKFGQTVVASVRFTNNMDPVKRFAPSPTSPTQPGGTPPPPPGGTPPGGDDN